MGPKWPLHSSVTGRFSHVPLSPEVLQKSSPVHLRHGAAAALTCVGPFHAALLRFVALSHATNSLVFVPGFAVGKLGNSNLSG